jgi:hypothetical protein
MAKCERQGSGSDTPSSLPLTPSARAAKARETAGVGVNLGGRAVAVWLS